MAKTLLDLKENVKLRARVNKKAYLAHLDKGFTPKCFLKIRSKHYCFTYLSTVESTFLAVQHVFS